MNKTYINNHIRELVKTGAVVVSGHEALERIITILEKNGISHESAAVEADKSPYDNIPTFIITRI